MAQAAAAAPGAAGVGASAQRPRLRESGRRFGVGVAPVYPYITEAVEVLAALGPTLSDAVGTAKGKAFVLRGQAQAAWREHAGAGRPSRTSALDLARVTGFDA